jgi:hypothetical protein
LAKIKCWKTAFEKINSVIEYLLTLHFISQGIEFKERSNYTELLEIAIINNIFAEKKIWALLQNFCRDARNHIHLIREITENIDFVCWYKIIEPIFTKILTHFNFEFK